MSQMKVSSTPYHIRIAPLLYDKRFYFIFCKFACKNFTNNLYKDEIRHTWGYNDLKKKKPLKV